MKRAEKKFIIAEYGRRHLYDYYCKYLKKKNEKHNIIDAKVHAKVLNDFNKEIRRKIIEECFDFIVPINMGLLNVKKFKPKYTIDSNGKLISKRLAINWEESKKIHKIVYHINKHTDGYKYKFNYSFYRSILPNKSFYKFVPCRTAKRILAKTIKNPDFKGDFYS